MVFSPRLCPPPYATSLALALFLPFHLLHSTSTPPLPLTPEAEGIAEGDHVATVCKNSAVFLATYYACSRLGAITTPINWRLTPPEVEYILHDAEARFFIW